MWMHATGDRIFAGDLRESLHVFKYRKAENQLYVLADDQTPRYAARRNWKREDTRTCGRRSVGRSSGIRY